jgi:hypothetical protein
MVYPSRAGRFGTKGLAITFQTSEADQEVMNQIQSRFEVAIPELPDHIDPASYSEFSPCDHVHEMRLTITSDLVNPAVCPTGTLAQLFSAHIVSCTQMLLRINHYVQNPCVHHVSEIVMCKSETSPQGSVHIWKPESLTSLRRAGFSPRSYSQCHLLLLLPQLLVHSAMYIGLV